MGRLIKRLFWLALLGSVTAQPVQAADADYLSVGVGAFDIIHHDYLAPAAFIAYRPSLRLFNDLVHPMFHGIGSMIGLQANTDGGVYGYGDLFLDIRPTDRIVFWPSGGIGGYQQGDSRDLGGIFEFHLEMYLGYHLGRSHMIGVSWQHISNAGSHDINPSSDSVFLTYTAGFPSLF